MLRLYSARTRPFERLTVFSVTRNCYLLFDYARARSLDGGKPLC